MRLRLRRGKPTETSRLEAFSDGVFAVAITLLARIWHASTPTQGRSRR